MDERADAPGPAVPAEDRHPHRRRRRIAQPKYKINVNTLEHIAAKTLELNEIGVCNITLDRPIPFDPYAENRDIGGFILIDRITNATVGAGLLHFALRRVAERPLAGARGRHARPAPASRASGPAWCGSPACPAPASRRSPTSSRRGCTPQGRHTYLLDGDNVRHGLNKDLGFTDADRVENIRRVAEVARLMVDAGLIVLVSFISPFRAERRMARELRRTTASSSRSSSTPRSTWPKRATARASTRKARRGELANFTGIDSPYEPPESPSSTSTPAPPNPPRPPSRSSSTCDRPAFLRHNHAPHRSTTERMSAMDDHARRRGASPPRQARCSRRSAL